MKRELPESYIAAALEMSAREKKFTETEVLEPVVTESPEAKLKLKAFKFDVDEISQRTSKAISPRRKTRPFNPAQPFSIDATLFKKLVTTLQMCELIEDEELSNGKHEYTLKGAN